MSSESAYPPEKLVPHSSEWGARYDALAADLLRSLGPEWSIEHVGSTSVPGLVAKPVIDLAIRVPEGHRLEEHVDVFRRHGWTAPVPTGDHQALFLLDRGVRTAIAHAFTAQEWPRVHVRLFADWLRSHPDDRAAYARLKVALVGRGTWGRGYTDAKHAFVEDVVNRARAARGLEAVTR